MKYYYSIFIVMLFILANKPSLIILGLCVFGGFWYLKNKNRKGNSSDVIWKKYNELTRNKIIFSKNTVNIYKGTSSLKYIFMHEDMKYILEDLDFILKFNPDIIIDIIILLEYFYKIHYNVMIEKYDACSYIPILQDIRNEVINIFSTFVFNLPDVSTTIDIPNIDEFMNTKLIEIKSLLQKQFIIIKNKFGCNYKFEFNEYDHTMDKNMLV